MERALDVLWVVTSVDAYDLLTRGRRRQPAEAAGTLVTVAEAELFRRGRRGDGAST